MARGLKAGSRVAIPTEQACEYVASYFGILAAGGVVGLNTQTSDHVLSSVLSDSGSSQRGSAQTTLAEKLIAVFRNVEIFIMYGQTEAAPQLSFLNPARIVDKAGSIGKAIPGVTLEVCRPDGSTAERDKVGEIVETGENVMAGYWRNPEETAKVLKNGKLWTGDLARFDKD